MDFQQFERSIIFTDIHFGLRNNSATHNQDCLDFIDAMIAHAHANDCETAIFMGDWHHSRNQINVSTLNYTHRALGKLSQNFKQVFFIVGNHDLFYRDKRDIHSIPMSELYPNIMPITEITTVGNATFVPWLVGDEWKKVKKIKSKYIFGHFEIPGFKMNNIVEVPDHGEISSSHFKYSDWVFSGHLHKRQINGNIIYTGNCFPHDYGDSGDTDRGWCTLADGEKPELHNWEGCPRFIRCNLSEIAADPDKFLIPKAYIKAVTDVDLSYEEVAHMKETFQNSFNIREFRLVAPSESVDGDSELTQEEESQSVDEIVTKQIEDLESDSFDKKLLLDIYNELG